VAARSGGGGITGDAGGLPLRKVEQRTGIPRQFAACFQDRRKPERIERRVEEPVSRRVYGLAPGNEDPNGRDQLRADPPPAVPAGKRTLDRRRRVRANRPSANQAQFPCFTGAG
jgi:hypothetical protein